MNQLTLNSIYIVATASALIFFFFLLLAVLKDIRRPRVVSRMPKDGPHISVIVVNNSSYERTMRSLRSIATSTYRNFDIVLLDNVSGRQDLTLYRKAQLNVDFKLYRRLKPASTENAIKAAYKRGKRGDLVLVLDSIDTVDSDALSDISQYFSDTSEVMAIHLNDVTAGDEGLVGLIASIEDALNRLKHKLRSSFKQKRSTVVRAGNSFRHTVLARKTRKTRITMAFYDRAIRNIEPDPAFGRRLRPRGRTAIALGVLATIVGCALAITAIEGSGVEALVACWVILIACITTLILVDSTLPIRQKSDVVVFLAVLPLLAFITLVVKRSPVR